MTYKKFKILPIFLILLFCIVNALPTKLDQYIYLNLTRSLPRGLYLVKKATPQVGDLVIIDLPLKLKNMLVQQADLNITSLLLKPIIAANGDYICTYEENILINHHLKLAKHHSIDLYVMCRKLTQQEFFVGIQSKDNSLDSRYFGPITFKDLRAVVIPLITFEW